jgi:Zn finger protein HypA/HybF involved in hydrogenase expression
MEIIFDDGDWLDVDRDMTGTVTIVVNDTVKANLGHIDLDQMLLPVINGIVDRLDLGVVVPTGDAYCRQCGHCHREQLQPAVWSCPDCDRVTDELGEEVIV